METARHCEPSRQRGAAIWGWVVRRDSGHGVCHSSGRLPRHPQGRRLKRPTYALPRGHVAAQEGRQLHIGHWWQVGAEGQDTLVFVIRRLIALALTFLLVLLDRREAGRDDDDLHLV